MRAGCSGDCRQGHRPCTNPGVCFRPTLTVHRTRLGLVARLARHGWDVLFWAVIAAWLLYLAYAWHAVRALG